MRARVQVPTLTNSCDQGLAGHQSNEDAGLSTRRTDSQALICIQSSVGPPLVPMAVGGCP